MLRSRSSKWAMAFVALLFWLGAGAQEVIRDVKMERAGSAFRIRYQLQKAPGTELRGTQLQVLRRRGGIVEEVFSGPIAPRPAGGGGRDAFTYSWLPTGISVEPGDAFQAKIILTYNKPAVARSPQPAATNQPPRAHAGAFTEVRLPLQAPIQLDGSASSDPDGNIVSSSWKQIGGPTTLRLSSAATLQATAGGEWKEGRYAFELTVKDAQGATATDRIIVTVKGPLTQAPQKTDVAAVPAQPATPVTTPPLRDSGASPQALAGSKVIPPAPKKDTAAATKQPAVVQQAVSHSRKPAARTAEKLKGGPANGLVNIILPGVGHYLVSGDHYGNERKAGTFLVTALYAGALGGSVYYKLKSNQAYNEYNNLASFREYQHDGNGNIIGVRGVSEAISAQHLHAAKTAQKNSLILLGVGAGILATDFVLTVVKGMKNKKRWKSEQTVKTNLFFGTEGRGGVAGVRIQF